MTEPTKECPAWINAPDDATAQLFREVVASFMETEKRLRENPPDWYLPPTTIIIGDRH